MYQHGWKRNVDYIMAFSHEDIQDVTWRYTNNHAQTRQIRSRCTEPDLLKTIVLLREKRQQKCTSARKKYLKIRNLREVIELMVQRQASENEKKGRSSGSLSWKLARGEEQQCNTSNNVNDLIFTQLIFFLIQFQSHTFFYLLDFISFLSSMQRNPKLLQNNSICDIRVLKMNMNDTYAIQMGN